MANFRDFVWNISPPWLRRTYGERFVGMTIGLMADLISEGAGQALKASWLHSDTSPPDALPEIGTERSMPRYYADTDATYRARLHAAWDAWQFAGNEEGTGGLGIIGQYNAMGLPNVTIVPAENLDPRVERPSWRFELVPTLSLSSNFTFDDDHVGTGNSAIIDNLGGNWEDLGWEAGAKVYIIGSASNDNDTGYEITSLQLSNMYLDGVVLTDEGPVAALVDGTNWSRFAVVVEPGHPWSTAHTYGSGLVYSSDDDAPTYGSTATAAEVRSVLSIARKWGPGHAVNPYVYIIFTGEYYGDPDHVYGDAGYVYGTGTNIKWANQV